MKVESKTNNVQYSHDFETTKFQIDSSAKAFELIAKNLYTRPIAAIVRELSANAVDSHTKAGNKDTPFDIKFPTLLNSNFVIRDYGVGLTPDEIRDLYTVVFRSDKRDTNEYHGAFGVGSKTPFAYTDSFTVESVVDGTKWIYVVHLDDERCPSISKMGEMDTDEHNGVKISFPVEKNDITRFAEARHELKFFNPAPNANVEIQSIHEDVEVFFENEDCIITKERGQSWYSHLFCGIDVIMGNISYKAHLSHRGAQSSSMSHRDLDDETVKIFDAFDNQNRTGGVKAEQLRSLKLYLKADIGDVNPAASREELHYDDKFLGFLNEKLIKLRDDYIEYVEREKFDPISNILELRKFSLENNFALYDVFLEAAGKKRTTKFDDDIDFETRHYHAEWNLVDQSKIVLSPNQRRHLSNVVRFQDIPKEFGVTKTKIINMVNGSNTFEPTDKTDGAFYWNQTCTFPSRASRVMYLFAIVDETRAIITRSRDYFAKYKYNANFHAGNGRELCALYCDDSKKEDLKKWLEDNFPNAIVEFTSNMPYESNAGTKKEISDYASADYCIFDLSTGKWAPSTKDDLPKFAYYCYVNSRVALSVKYFKDTEPTCISTCYQNDLREFAKFFDIPIVGVKRSHEEEGEYFLHEVPDNWKTIDSLIKEIDEMTSKFKFTDVPRGYGRLYTNSCFDKFQTLDDIDPGGFSGTGSDAIDSFLECEKRGLIDNIPQKIMDTFSFNACLNNFIALSRTDFKHHLKKLCDSGIFSTVINIANSSDSYFDSESFREDIGILAFVKPQWRYTSNSADVMAPVHLKYFADCYNAMFNEGDGEN